MLQSFKVYFTFLVVKKYLFFKANFLCFKYSQLNQQLFFVINKWYIKFYLSHINQSES